ncbi:unnamed protein product [Fusarium fujikuroi]|uniref:Uncharacterized protein n=1 Tax=Fusarium fujikuroi TaxID=5127 RepID=A0A9Q9UC27_FUSFU|nr:unnamed protein product [Fusarium fujikuroi]
MSARLTYRINITNCYDKAACLAELEEAVEAGRSVMGKEGMRRKTIVDNTLPLFAWQLMSHLSRKLRIM